MRWVCFALQSKRVLIWVSGSTSSFFGRGVSFSIISSSTTFSISCQSNLESCSTYLSIYVFAARDSFGNLRDKAANVVATCNQHALAAVVNCVTYFASRWTSTILSSSFGPYPERSELGAMTAVLLSTSVATLSANIYSGTYTVSTSPAQQSRLCVSFNINSCFYFQPEVFSRQLFSRSVSGSRRVKCYILSQFGISQYCRFPLPITTISLTVTDKKYRPDKFFSCYRNEDFCWQIFFNKYNRLTKPAFFFPFISNKCYWSESTCRCR